MKLTINPHGMTSADEPALRADPLETLGRLAWRWAIVYFLVAAIPAALIFLFTLL
jgi:hypothetical protein